MITKRWVAYSALFGLAGLCVAAVAVAAVSVAGSMLVTEAAPPEEDFQGAWCSAQGDVLTLDPGNRFTLVPMSAAFAGQITFVSTESFARESAAGRWYLDTSGADLMDPRPVRIGVDVDLLDDRPIDGESLDLNAVEVDGGWALHLQSLSLTACPGL
ncbi:MULTISPECIES: hypothetical protein [Actinoplanes]|uniref:hypothetical protein n=1 Tax=Actinoplanes TaxID=1865 RepID=UPI0005F27E52|nr:MULTISPECIES: hypothetical protein [Actinoplanes]GLY07109.1 hypothetical protein Acsp01_74880 [Actinoplanes sp. NBRC 101535]